MFKQNIKGLKVINSLYANTRNEIFFPYVGIFSFSSPSTTSNNVSLLGYASAAEK